MNSAALPHSTPEAQGISSSAILDFLDAVESHSLELHSLMLLRHGHVIAQGWWAPYAATLPHLLYSLSKSFTSTAAGMAIEEGSFSLDDPVLKFFPEDAPATVTENLAAMRLRHLLSMSTGHAKDTTGFMVGSEDGNWVRAFLARPVAYEPGTHFLYNSGATYMVSAILQKVTGQTLLQFLEPRLFAPLGIKDAISQSCPRGINNGGWGMSAKTEDIAKFGQLYLQKGMWNGKQLLSESWIETATSKQISNGDDPENDWNQGYGFQFWRCRHNAYRGDGAFGQYCVVMPDQDAVLAITSNVGDVKTVLNLAWEHLLPAFLEAAIPENDAAFMPLVERLANLQIEAPKGDTSSPISSYISGQTYHFADNEQGIESMTFEVRGRDCMLTFHDTAGVHQVVCGLGEWKNDSTSFLQNRFGVVSGAATKSKTCAYGTWVSPESFTMKLCFIEAPFTPTLTCHFSPDDTLLFDLRGRIGFGPAERPLLEGQKI